MPPVKRHYHAPGRQEQAAQTRQRIAAAAAEFAEHGWAGTTVAAIAKRAQVTPQAGRSGQRPATGRPSSSSRAPGPDADEERLRLLIDTIWVLAGPAVYVDLVYRRGWPPGQYASWLADQLAAAVQVAHRPP